MIDAEHDTPSTAPATPVANVSAKTRARKPRAEKQNPETQGAKKVKEKRIKHAKETANANALDSPWTPMNWNEKGGQYAQHYPFVVSRKGVCDPNQLGPDDKPVEAIICLAGPTSRLLRFASERAALMRATMQNQINMELF